MFQLASVFISLKMLKYSVSSSVQKGTEVAVYSASLPLPTSISGLSMSLPLLHSNISKARFQIIWFVLCSKSEKQRFDVLVRLLSKNLIWFSNIWFCLLCPKMTESGLMSCFFSPKSQVDDSDVLARLLSKTNLSAGHDLSFCLSVDINIWSLDTVLLLQSKVLRREKDALSPLLSKASVFMVRSCSGPPIFEIDYGTRGCVFILLFKTSKSKSYVCLSFLSPPRILLIVEFCSPA